jgi:hypothetical protein
METAKDPITEALDQLTKLDEQLAKGRITKTEFEQQRVLVLVDLVIAKS